MAEDDWLISASRARDERQPGRIRLGKLDYNIIMGWPVNEVFGVVMVVLLGGRVVVNSRLTTGERTGSKW